MLSLLPYFLLCHTLAIPLLCLYFTSYLCSHALSSHNPYVKVLSSLLMVFFLCSCHASMNILGHMPMYSLFYPISEGIGQFSKYMKCVCVCVWRDSEWEREIDYRYHRIFHTDTYPTIMTVIYPQRWRPKDTITRKFTLLKVLCWGINL